MPRTFLALCLAAAASFPAPAGATGGPPEGERCGFATATDGTDPDAPETFHGVLYGGPLRAAGSAVTITCSVAVNAPRHADPAVATESSDPGPGVAVLAPRRLSYTAEDWDSVYLCTAATVDGTAWYWDDVAAAWSTDPASWCEDTTDYRTEPPPEWCFETLSCVEPLVDQMVCPVFAAVPSVPGVLDVEYDGDLHVAGEPFWDCPPYDEWTRQEGVARRGDGDRA
jgi:hypothetical protein